jgi:hypothetical protein
MIVATFVGVYLVLIFIRLYMLNRRAKEIALKALEKRHHIETGVIPELQDDEDLSLQDRQYLACGANLAYLKGDRMNTLETDGDQDEIRNMLKKDWHITSRDTLMSKITWLRNKGHRSYFKPIWGILSSTSVQDSMERITRLQDEFAAKGDNTSIELYAANVSAGYKFLREQTNYFEGKRCKMDALTWDLGRVINLTRWGYDAGFLSRGESMDIIRASGKQLLDNYTSWENLGENYLIGFAMWSGNLHELEELHDGHCELLSEEDSPWVLLERT